MEPDIDRYVRYPTRVWVLAAFCFLNFSNAVLWVTFSTISDIAQCYFGDDSSTTKVNTLATIFLILYPVGTVLEVVFFKRYGLRQTLLLGGILTTAGAALRLAVAECRDFVSPNTLYGVMLLGQGLAALSQPLFVNFPAHLSSAWMAVEERDLSTTVGSLFSPIGNAIGQLLPVLLVSMDSDSKKVSGMENLMLVEFLICGVGLLLGYLVIADAPPTPPSKSCQTGTTSQPSTQSSGQPTSWPSNIPTGQPLPKDDDIYALLATPEEKTPPSSSSPVQQAWADCRVLLTDWNYMTLWLAFSLLLGIFNSLLTLVNQVVKPWGYSNNDASYAGMALIIAGLLGAVVCSVVMERTKAYLTIVRCGFFACFFSTIVLISMLKPENLAGLLLGWALVGFCLLPMLPACFELIAEITYPITSDISVGLLLVGGNVLGIPLVYVLESLIPTVAWKNAPGSSLFVVLVVSVASSLLLLVRPTFKRRMAEEGEQSSPQLDRPLLAGEGK